MSPTVRSKSRQIAASVQTAKLQCSAFCPLAKKREIVFESLVALGLLSVDWAAKASFVTFRAALKGFFETVRFTNWEQLLFRRKTWATSLMLTFINLVLVAFFVDVRLETIGNQGDDGKCMWILWTRLGLKVVEVSLKCTCYGYKWECFLYWLHSSRAFILCCKNRLNRRISLLSGKINSTLLQ